MLILNLCTWGGFMVPANQGAYRAHSAKAYWKYELLTVQQWHNHFKQVWRDWLILCSWSDYEKVAMFFLFCLLFCFFCRVENTMLFLYTNLCMAVTELSEGIGWVFTLLPPNLWQIHAHKWIPLILSDWDCVFS